MQAWRGGDGELDFPQSTQPPKAQVPAAEVAKVSLDDLSRIMAPWGMLIRAFLLLEVRVSACV
jgi:hypothetical protein